MLNHWIKKYSRNLIYLMVGLLFMGCASSQMEMRKNIQNAKISVKDVVVESVSWGENGKIELKLSLEAFNPSPNLMKLDSIVSDVLVDDQKIAQLKHLNHLDIQPKESQVIDLDVISNFGVVQWMSLMAMEGEDISLKFEGVAWSKVEYFGFWDSMKETPFQITRKIPKALIEAQLKGFLQEKMKGFFQLPGGLLPNAPNFNQAF